MTDSALSQANAYLDTLRKNLTSKHRAALLRWVLALEGKTPTIYRQCNDVLHDASGGFCCLGVAADIVNPKGWRLAEGGEAHYFMSGDHGVLPEAVADKYGLGSDPYLRGAALKDGSSCEFGQRDFKKGDVVVLIATVWNDSQGATFAQIAQMIRETYDIHDDTQRE